MWASRERSSGVVSGGQDGCRRWSERGKEGDAYGISTSAFGATGKVVWSTYDGGQTPQTHSSYERGWGRHRTRMPYGPVAHINEKSLQLFWRLMNGANLHWLPHKVYCQDTRG
jgi:hypothetical protein